MNNQRWTMIALILAILGLLVGAYGIYQATTSQAKFETALSAAQAGAPPLSPAKPTQLKNVIMDPSRVPPPITRTEPTTVNVNLTVQEVASEIADGETFTFWTFNGTVPGPMIRVM